MPCGRAKMAKNTPAVIFTCIFVNENGCFSIQISLKCKDRCPTNNKPALVQILAWPNRPQAMNDDGLFCLTHICVIDRSHDMTDALGPSRAWPSAGIALTANLDIHVFPQRFLVCWLLFFTPDDVSQTTADISRNLWTFKDYSWYMYSLILTGTRCRYLSQSALTSTLPFNVKCHA